VQVKNPKAPAVQREAEELGLATLDKIEKPKPPAVKREADFEGGKKQMAKPPIAKKKLLTSKRGSVSRKGREITISVPFTWTMRREMHLKTNDTLALTLRIKLDENELAKMLERAGPPPEGKSFPGWVIEKVVTAGLIEAVQKGVDVHLTSIAHAG
jgi:hypothetical protein